MRSISALLANSWSDVYMKFLILDLKFPLACSESKLHRNTVNYQNIFWPILVTEQYLSEFPPKYLDQNRRKFSYSLLKISQLILRRAVLSGYFTHTKSIFWFQLTYVTVVKKQFQKGVCYFSVLCFRLEKLESTQSKQPLSKPSDWLIQPNSLNRSLLLNRRSFVQNYRGFILQLFGTFTPNAILIA